MVEVGISTASLFKKQYNEDALPTLDSIDSRVCEVFLESYCEYTEEFAKLLLGKLGNLKVHSIHTNTIQFEPTLFSDNPRAYQDAFSAFENVLKASKILGATNYTMHGRARFRKSSNYDNYKEVAFYFNKLIDLCEKYNVYMCLENVEWAFYNRPGFFAEVKKDCPRLKGVLDVKQAFLSGYDYTDYLNEMGEDINTVHLCDRDENGKGCMPGRGVFDFETLFKKLKDVGFKGNMLIEVYDSAFKEISELKQSLDIIREIKQKVF